MAIQNPVNPQQSQQAQHTLTPQELYALTGGAKYGEQVDEVGGSGDFIDVISFRDTAMVRYIRYHEWMELVLGTAVETRKFVAGPKSTTDIEATAKSQYLDKLSVTSKDSLNSVGELDEEAQKRKAFYRKAAEELREDFGLQSSSTITDTSKEPLENVLEKELKDKFGLCVVEKPTVKRVNVSFKVPEQLTKQAVEASKGPIPQPVVAAPPPQQQQQAPQQPQPQQPQQQQNIPYQQQQALQGMPVNTQQMPGMPIQAQGSMMQGIPTTGMPGGQPIAMPMGMTGMPMQPVPMQQQQQVPVQMPPGSQDVNMSGQGMGPNSN